MSLAGCGSPVLSNRGGAETNMMGSEPGSRLSHVCLLSVHFGSDQVCGWPVAGMNNCLRSNSDNFMRGGGISERSAGAGISIDGFAVTRLDAPICHRLRHRSHPLCVTRNIFAFVRRRWRRRRWSLVSRCGSHTVVTAFDRKHRRENDRSSRSG
jgi:hypothetical protein